jgi:hypothetical protein
MKSSFSPVENTVSKAIPARWAKSSSRRSVVQRAALSDVSGEFQSSKRSRSVPVQIT